MTKNHLILLDINNSLDILDRRVGAAMSTIERWLRGFKMGLYSGTGSLLVLAAWKLRDYPLNLGPIWG